MLIQALSPVVLLMLVSYSQQFKESRNLGSLFLLISAIARGAVSLKYSMNLVAFQARLQLPAKYTQLSRHRVKQHGCI